MITLKNFNDATARKRNDMVKRVGPRYYKTGRRAGQLRKAGRQLPFTLEEFRAWAWNLMGLQQVKCYYCPRLIDVLHFEPDHRVPVSQRGSLGLENLVACCEDCNQLKGEMLFEEFLALQEFATKLSRAGRADLLKRLRAGAMGIRLRHHLHTPAENAAKQPKHSAPIVKQRSMDYEQF